MAHVSLGRGRGGGRRVLPVDDLPQRRSSLERQLAKAGLAAVA